MDFNLEYLYSSEVLSGIAGAIVALKFAPGLSRIGKLTHVLCGSACAFFGTPAIVEWTHLTSQGMVSFLSFVTGLFGLNLASSIALAIKSIDISKVISNLVGSRGP